MAKKKIQNPTNLNCFLRLCWFQKRIHFFFFFFFFLNLYLSIILDNYHVGLPVRNFNLSSVYPDLILYWLHYHAKFFTFPPNFIFDFCWNQLVQIIIIYLHIVLILSQSPPFNLKSFFKSSKIKSLPFGIDPTAQLLTNFRPKKFPQKFILAD